MSGEAFHEHSITILALMGASYIRVYCVINRRYP